MRRVSRSWPEGTQIKPRFSQQAG